MEYTQDFKDLLKIAEACDQTYVGHGNPNAQILIIANEPAADKGSAFGKDLIHYDLEQNRNTWNENSINNIDLNHLPDVFDENDNIDWNRFNPLWPFKGQRYNVIRTKKTSEEKVEILNKQNYPTSRTWYQYQKLVDMIHDSNKENPQCHKLKEDTLNFFRHAFIMDFSSEYGKTSKDIDPQKRKKSIEARLPLFSSAFVSHFPVIIVASGNYIKDIKVLNDLRKVFLGFENIEVKFESDKHGWRNIHISRDGKRILIHSKHLASAIKDDYLREIAKLCSCHID